MPLPQPTHKNAALRVMQIIAAALMMGVVSFGAVAALFMTGGESDVPRTMLLAPMAAAATLLILVVCAIMPASGGRAEGSAAASSPASSSSDPAAKELRLYGAYQTRMIVRYALLEGAAMFNLVAAMVDKQPYSLGIAGLLALLMAAMYPTRGRVEAFVKSKMELSGLTDMRDPRWG